jgi:hypothetical protein
MIQPITILHLKIIHKEPLRALTESYVGAAGAVILRICVLLFAAAADRRVAAILLGFVVPYKSVLAGELEKRVSANTGK